MAATLRELRGRIRSAGSIKKITKAQEMIATSRIGKAQARLESARPYAFQITAMLTTLAAEAALDHPLLVERPEPKRAGVLVVSSDRGLCGAYNSSIFRRSEELFSLLREEGKTPVLYTVGRKAQNYFKFRNWDITESWTGFSEQPKYENAAEIGSTLVDAFMKGAGDDEISSREDDQGVDELHIVYSEFKSMMSQTAVAHRIAPLVVEYVEEDTRTPYAVLVRAGRDDAFRVAAAAVPDHPRLRGVTRIRRIGAGVAPTGDEVGNRQRGRPDQRADADGEPRAAGPDHPGDQRNRRRRKRARRRR